MMQMPGCDELRILEIGSIDDESRSGIHRLVKASNMGTVKSISPQRGE